MATSRPSSEFRFAVITDLHCAWHYLEAFITWVKQTDHPRVDAVFVAGDMLNVSHEPNNQHLAHLTGATMDPPTKSSELPTDSTADTQDYVQLLQKLDTLGIPVYVIPGNHDLWGAYNHDSPIWKNASYPNVHYAHGEVSQLTPPDLWLAGLGGSTPVILKHRPAETVWDGFPYNESSLAADLAFVQSRLECTQTGVDRSTASVVWLTHVGPSDCDTSCVNRDSRLAPSNEEEFGSQALRTHLVTLDQHPWLTNALLVHGHAHGAWGLAHLGPLRVLNPGALRDGRFAVVTLRRPLLESESSTWQIHSCLFQCLDAEPCPTK
ncbi:hypothetical protein IWQ62_002771 [Dispira parvispora]|uniref:Calcineurin-like phosphoesterase domain-containing protein n=1 Tax=Dispira parvispora TaxID=1520584 RepID=A0A9W8AW28_9FUNG|nr:hypothetical protein IWQ62_002771 [Dispira parvispora]